MPIKYIRIRCTFIKLLYNLGKRNYIVSHEFQDIIRFFQVFSPRIKNALSESPNLSSVINLLFQFFIDIWDHSVKTQVFKKLTYLTL